MIWLNEGVAENPINRVSRIKKSKVMAENKIPSIEDIWTSNKVHKTTGQKLLATLVWLLLQKAFWGFVVFAVILYTCSGSGDVIKTQKDLVGTTWQNTSSYNSIGAWYKVKITSSNTYEAWYSHPSDGRWNNHHTGYYSIQESRDGSNGEAVFIITLSAYKLPGVSHLIVYKGSKDGRFTSNPFIDNDFRGVQALQTSNNPW